MKIGLATLILSFILVASCAYGADSISGSNTGLTGLWEYPTAEMPEDGHGRFGYTHAAPYRYYFIDFAWLPWLEVNGRFSTFDDISGGGTGDYMDKAIDLKAMLYRSKDARKWYLPSVAFGVMDMMGTELMKSYYGVATWKLGDFSVSAGYGTDRMNGAFGGVTWNIADWLAIKAEYSPLDYQADRAGSVPIHPQKASSKFNYGLVLKAPWGTEASFSRQRDEEFVITVSQRINFNGPFLFSDKSHTRAINKPGDPRVADWNDVNEEEVVKRIEAGLDKYVRVRDVEIEVWDTEGKEVLVAYENYGHASHAEAMLRVLVVLSAVLPETNKVTLVPRISGVPIVSAAFPGSMLFDLRARALRDDEALQPAVFTWAEEGRTEVEDKSDEEGIVTGTGRIYKGPKVYRSTRLANKARHELKVMGVYEPRVDQSVNAQYANRWSLDAVYQGRYSNGWGAYVDVRFPLYNNVDIWWEPDMNDKIRLQQAAATYVKDWDRFWLFGEAGWLDEEYFGANVWGRYYAEDGRWWVGARLAAQRTRDPQSFAGLADGMIEYYNKPAYDPARGGDYYDTGEDPWRLMAWIQAGYNFANPDLDLQLDWGRFVDNDTGFKVAATRHWDDTALGFWWTRTDRLTSGKDYTRVGVHMELPAEKWLGSLFGASSAHIWEQDTILPSSWRIDAGREGGHVRTPERLLSQLRPIVLKQNVSQLLKEYCSYEVGSDRDQGPESLVELVGNW